MVTPVVEASGGKGPKSGSASKQALRQVNAEQSLETGNADAELVREKRRPLSPWEGEQYVHWGEPPGYWARACGQRTMHQHGRPSWPGARVGPERTDRCPARGRSGTRWESDRSILPVSSEKVRGREGALVQGKRRKERERRVAVRLQPPLRIRKLQMTLQEKAKASSTSSPSGDVRGAYRGHNPAPTLSGSRMREIRLFGLMSGEWKRPIGRDTQALSYRKGQLPLWLSYVAPRHFSTPHKFRGRAAANGLGCEAGRRFSTGVV